MQLKHDATESGTFRDAHGFIALATLDGVELARDDDFQHNRSYHKRTEKTAGIVREVARKVAAASEEAKSAATMERKAVEVAESTVGAPAAAAV